MLGLPGYGYVVKPAPGSEWHEGVKHELLYESAIPLLNIYSKNGNICSHKNCTQIFILTLFIIAKKIETTQMSMN